jgi:glucose/arabinose dehydrogenase
MLANGRRRQLPVAAFIALGVLLAVAALVLVPDARVLGAPAKQGGFTLTLVPFVSGLIQPLLVTHGGDGSNRLYVVEKMGRVRLVVGGVLQATPFLDISSIVKSDGSEQGLLGLAFHPRYATNGFLYVNYIDAGGNTVVARYTAAASRTTVDPSTASLVLGVPQPASNHNGGMLAFGRDGYLYVGLGDGGGGGDPNNNGQNRNTLLGKLLRLDVDGAAPYAIPLSNPFVGVSGTRPEIWALGLRNPWRFGFDRATGDLYIGDVGQGTYEEIDRQPARSTGGENYGWRIMEGFHCYNATTCNQDGLTLPILEYDHSLGNCSVTGGYVYRGTTIPELAGAYIYGDFCSGRIWGARAGAGGTWASSLLLDSPYSISSFGEDQAGELYLTDLSGGGVYRLASSAPASTPTPTSTSLGSPTPTPPRTATPTTTSTVPSATRVGQAIRTSGSVRGQWVKTGSGAYNFNATGPANTQPGSAPSITLVTTTGTVTGPCSAVGASAPFTTTCSGTTTGDLSLNDPVTVSFALAGGGVSLSTGTPLPPILLGDINVDNIVDVRDYGRWRQAFGQSDCGNVADLDLDCFVDIRDYAIWRRWFGN